MEGSGILFKFISALFVTCIDLMKQYEAVSKKTDTKGNSSTDELINVAFDVDIISDLIVKFNQAINTVLFDDKKIEYQNGSLNDMINVKQTCGMHFGLSLFKVYSKQCIIRLII
jgi:hypothetical protein